MYCYWLSLSLCLCSIGHHFCTYTAEEISSYRKNPCGTISKFLFTCGGMVGVGFCARYCYTVLNDTANMVIADCSKAESRIESQVTALLNTTETFCPDLQDEIRKLNQQILLMQQACLHCTGHLPRNPQGILSSYNASKRAGSASNFRRIKLQNIKSQKTKGY